jgi:hypothetical protein
MVRFRRRLFEDEVAPEILLISSLAMSIAKVT